MKTRDDLEGYLFRVDPDFEEVDEGMFMVRTDAAGAPIVVHHLEPVLVIRMKVMDLPQDHADPSGLYETLLTLNATDVMHGAYGIEEGELILSDTLQIGTLDFEELRASLDSIQLAAASHIERIRELAGGGAQK